MEKTKVNTRIWELDFLRGIALLLMIYFHLIYDMNEIYDYKVDYESGFNYLTGKAAGILFILISGISCSLTRSNFKRGIRVFAIAMVLTLVTYIYNPKFVILFGILHFLGICMIFSTYFARINPLFLFGIGTLVIVSDILVNRVDVTHNYLFVFGFINSSFLSSDYYPLIPWFGVFLYGIAIGNLVYSGKRSLLKFNMSNNWVSKLGRHTLVCYIIHQPLIIGFLTIVRYLSKK